MKKYNINIIGAGNVGLAMARQLHGISNLNVKIFNRTKIDVKNIDFPIFTNIETSDLTADLFIIAVSDGAIATVAASLAARLGARADQTLVVHTAGGVSTDVLLPHFSQVGTLYPLQTFSKQRLVDWSAVPMFVAAPPQYLDFLKGIAAHFSEKIYEMTDEKRAALHVSAVFVNNFTNYLCHLAAEIANSQQLPFDVLQPLLKETVEKLEKMPALTAQTGPARRADYKTIEKQKLFLDTLNIENRTTAKNLYEIFTNAILTKFHGE